VLRILLLVASSLLLGVFLFLILWDEKPASRQVEIEVPASALPP
jgi:hypothetical protein